MANFYLRRTASALALILALAPTSAFAQEPSATGNVGGGPSSAFAQELPATSIVSDGTGTVYLTPTHLSFWLKFTLPTGDLEKGLAAATGQEAALREYLGLRELRPSAIDIYPPGVTSLHDSSSNFSVELRFSMAGLIGGDGGAAKFGALCEAIKLLGSEFACEISEPELIVAEKGVVIQDAVQEATRQAFTAAAGAASALGSAIQAVEKIRIHEVTWNEPPDAETAYPNIELVACTAKVTVTYGIQ